MKGSNLCFIILVYGLYVIYYMLMKGSRFMFVNTDYLDYHYLVDVSDNYVVLARSSHVNGSFEYPETYPVIYQYLKPSTLTIESTMTTRSNLYFYSVDVDDDFYSRGDCPQIMLGVYACIFFILFVINGLTRFVKKGGIFFGP